MSDEQRVPVIAAFQTDLDQVKAIVDSVAGVTADDLEDKAQIKRVKEARLSLRSVRVAVQKKGKSLRDDANAYAKSVIEKEKELIGIITPEEDRLQQIEDEAAEREERKARYAQLPTRHQRLAGLKDGIEITDEELLGMDDAAFDEYINKRITEYNDKKTREIEQREREIQEREAAIKREEDDKKRAQEIEQAKEEARHQERKRLEKEAQEAEERHRQQEEADRKRAEADANFQAWLTSHGYTEGSPDMYLNQSGNEAVLWKKVGSYTIER